jgi:flavin reductase (DIM6/NTAB) family NADH-FMN oxidoreductase RutF
MMFDFETLADRDRYKLLVSTVVPRPIAWVTTQDIDGRVNAAPYSFFNVFGEDPPVLMFGIGGREPGDAKDTGNNIRRTGQFVVNLVGYENAQAMNVTAIDFGAEIAELHEAGLTPVPSAKVKPPRIAESPVSFECERLMLLDLGVKRTLVLGRIVALHVRDEAVLDKDRCYIDTPKLDLVGRMHGAGWYARTTERFEMPRIPVKDWKRAAE